MQHAEVTAVILAGGVGKRFVPFKTDKTLFPFLGQSLLERTLGMVSKAGIQSVIVAVNPYNQTWVQAAQTRFPELNITTQLQEKPQGMGDALLTLRDLLPEQHIVVMNAGDMVTPDLLNNLLNTADGKETVLTGMYTPEYQPLGYFVLDENEKVVGIMEKPGADNMPSHLSNLVFHYFADAQGFVSLVADAQATATAESDDVYEQALDRLMKTQPVDVFRYEGPWQKLKFGYHVLDMIEFFLQPLSRDISAEAEIAPTAVVNGEVVVAPGARILDGAIVQGPCYIGPNALIGNNALVRNSIVETGAVVGFGSEVVRSYVGPKCDLHHAYVGDSVLEEGVHFGFNAHTANYRFDHQPVPMKWVTGKTETPKNKLGALIAKNTEIGVNASLLPGVCIGTKAVIYPATVVFAAVPDHAVVKENRTQTIETQPTTD
ncbi:NTP transferase domain-containing protein [Candidatus Woesebacteria bacterium]|nr:NTP transferase domain-containing protein [Candidatus Woesebacteria bacterium]MCD8506884.1 NTP transferase domain-containing protein [Candidatus Woesebacteria bacterium]MCD8527496.1 NTP transferase domain-containing protein [Candidatus Woesebacteria bacterium]MCD8546237.1 NTP transferase domain-containing protein [Candidatus Woesebacteria bacterium]